MPYNSIGLRSARGSGTSGYVESNLSTTCDNEDVSRLGFHKRRRKRDESIQKNDDMKAKSKKIFSARKEIARHEKKRQVELECAKLRAELEKENVPQVDIKQRIGDLREMMIANLFPEVGEGKQNINADKPKEYVSPNYNYKRRYESTHSSRAVRRQN